MIKKSKILEDRGTANSTEQSKRVPSQRHIGYSALASIRLSTALDPLELGLFLLIARYVPNVAKRSI